MKQRVWDLPTRLFHWSLVLLIGLSWWTAETDQDDLHLWLGYGVLFLLVFRVLWGFLGSSTARFSAFVRGPRAVVEYVRNRFRWPLAGHAPLGALSVLALLALLIVQVGTGLFAMDEDGLFGGPLAYLVGIGTSDTLTELHEELFDWLLILIGLHIAAILLYRLALGRNLLGPMISGKADLPRGMEPMRPATPLVAIVCVLVALAATAWVMLGAPPL
ncbi:MAG TPA: cytochrome b/b6 domain-containing protein [Sphingomicrobium sp.]|nr:cytochrome b/b6 domain-containing protein [Sphingomicrobium sp.]